MTDLVPEEYNSDDLDKLVVERDRRQTMRYVVIENTPGYVPEDDDPFVTDDYQDAVAYANELADQLEEQGYETDRSWASHDNMFAISATNPSKIHDLGRWIEVCKDEEE